MCREGGSDRRVCSLFRDRRVRSIWRHGAHRARHLVAPMTTSPNLPAAYAPTGSALAAGAILTRARRLFSFRIAADRLPGGKPAPIDGVLPRRSAHPSCSFERGPTHNEGGYGSERNEIGVGFGADVVGRGPVGRHPSFLSPALVTSGVSQPQRVRSGDSIVGISHRALGNSSREIGGHEHVCVR